MFKAIQNELTYSRILYVETMDSELISMEIGTWGDSELEKVPTPADDGQRTWAYDPNSQKIQTTVSLVLENAFCDLTDDDKLGFGCQVSPGPQSTRAGIVQIKYCISNFLIHV